MNVDDDDRIVSKSGSTPKTALIAIGLGIAAIAVVSMLLIGRNGESPEQPVVEIDSVPAAKAPTPAATSKAPPPPAAQPAPTQTARAPSTPPPPPLPALSDSDDEVRATLSDFLPTPFVASLKPEQLVSRTAVLLSNGANGKVLRDKLPLPRPNGKFVVEERSPGEAVLSSSNYGRYTGVVDALTSVEPDSAAGWFKRYEPLFDMAYADMGESTHSARSDLQATIRVMLDASYPTEAPALVQPSVFYKYADPALEAQPDSVKALIRMGPENRAEVLRWLRQLEAAL